MKGEYKQECNITTCQKPNSATWFNHSTRKYYCKACAKRLNEDEFNKRDAMRLYGHDLCTEVFPDPVELDTIPAFPVFKTTHSTARGESRKVPTFAKDKIVIIDGCPPIENIKKAISDIKDKGAVIIIDNLDKLTPDK